MRAAFDQRGQALVEACMSLACLAFFAKVFLVALYSAFACLWLDYQVYELAVCTSEFQRTQGECKGAFYRQTRGLLPIGEIHNLEVQKTRYLISARAEFRVIHQLILRRSSLLPLPLSED